MRWEEFKAARPRWLPWASCTSNKDGEEGDFKLYGEAVDVRDEAKMQAYAAAIKARIDRVPPGPYHLLRIDVRSARFVVFGDKRYGLAWDPAGALRCWSVG